MTVAAAAADVYGGRSVNKLTDAELAAGVRSTFAAANGAARKSTYAGSLGLGEAARCGQLLVEAKARQRHGAWVPWLEAHVPEVSERTAQTYMTLARGVARGYVLGDGESIRSAVRTIRNASYLGEEELLFRGARLGPVETRYTAAEIRRALIQHGVGKDAQTAVLESLNMNRETR
jgi:hypothetical protein